MRNINDFSKIHINDFIIEESYLAIYFFTIVIPLIIFSPSIIKWYHHKNHKNKNYKDYKNSILEMYEKTTKFIQELPEKTVIEPWPTWWLPISIILPCLAYYRKEKSGIRQNGIPVNSYALEMSDEKIKKDIMTSKNNHEIDKKLIDYFKEEGTLFNRYNPNSFKNDFLFTIRIKDLELCNKIWSSAYGITIRTGEMTLYRRDTRKPYTIFKEGFQLDPSVNYPAANKSNGTSLVTLNWGISTSDKIPPKEYGPRGYYTIKLPKNHNLIVVDIINSPRNQHELQKQGRTAYAKNRRNLSEFNVLNEIPPQFIQSFTYSKEREWCGLFAKKENNKKFNANYIAKTKPMGIV